MSRPVARPGTARRFRAFPLAVASLLVLAGCTAPTVIENSSVTVAVDQAFFSLNDRTSYGNSVANSQVLQATSSRFSAYDAKSELVTDPSFGTYQLLSNDPLTVRYTIADGVTWSDGVPVDAADLLLAWAANSGSLNTKDFDDRGFIDSETGRYAEPFPDDVVHFDGATSEGLQYVSAVPEIGDAGRSLTLTWDQYFVDWPLVLEVGLPAHVVAERALDTAAPDPDADARSELLRTAGVAKDALITAIETDDTADLSAIANVWNSDFNIDRMPDDPSLLVSTGPYTITDFAAGESLVLSANPRYRGDHSPVFETITVRFMADPLSQIQALADGVIDVITPHPSPDVVGALQGVSGASVLEGFDGTYEHLDLRFADSKNGTFDDPRVREAFLKVVPRQDILEAMVTRADGEAPLRSSQLFFPGQAGYEASVAANGSGEFGRVDVAGAKRLLAEAGVASPVVCVLFDPPNPNRQEEFRLLGESAAAAGFVVTNCSSPDWLGLLSTPGTYDASIFAWRVTNLSFAGVQAIFVTGGLSNLNGYSSPEVDELLAKLSVTIEPEQERALRERIDAILFADAYGLPLYQDPVVAAHRDSVSGVALAPLAPGILWNVWEWVPVLYTSPSPSSTPASG